jgi:hypothetical protein
MPRISIQVMPADTPHAGLLGAFVVAVTGQPPAIVYLDSALDGQVVESADVAETIDVVFRALQMEALTGSVSLTKIEEAAQRWKEQIVEVGSGPAVVVRDTQNRAGAILAFGPDAWRQFATAIKDADKP